MRAINLNKELPCEYICHQIQMLINDYKKEYPESRETVLIMEIKQIEDASQAVSVPLIEYHGG